MTKKKRTTSNGKKSRRKVETTPEWAKVQRDFLACGRCGYFLAGYRVLRGLPELEAAIAESKGEWLTLHWDEDTRRLMQKSLGCHLDVEWHHFESICPACYRRFRVTPVGPVAGPDEALSESGHVENEPSPTEASAVQDAAAEGLVADDSTVVDTVAEATVAEATVTEATVTEATVAEATVAEATVAEDTEDTIGETSSIETSSIEASSIEVSILEGPIVEVPVVETTVGADPESRDGD
jgi:hypothetical protein